MNLNGRRTIYTDELNINADNFARVLDNALRVHEANRIEMEYLYKYCKGEQPILERAKEIRPEINTKMVENHAKEIIDFKIGYEAGSPITFVQRASKDIKKSDTTSDDYRVSALNEMMFEENKPAKDVQLFKDFKTVGVGYMAAFPKANSESVSPFDLLVLNPLNTFVVKTNDSYRKPIMAVTYAILENSEKEIVAYTDQLVFTGRYARVQKKKDKDKAYDVNGFTVTPNLIGAIPIIEFVNNYDLLGAFEPVIPLMDALNVVNSDRVNDVAQFVQSLLWLHNCDIDEEGKQELVDGNGLIVTKSTGDGRDAKIVYLTQTLNQSETQTLADAIYDQILQISGVPGRDISSGGMTGSAVLLSNGWQIAETQAKAMELVFSQSEKELLNVCLKIIKSTKDLDSEIKSLNLSDVLVKFSRNKTYDLNNRVNAMVTMIKNGIDVNKAITTVDIFDDSHQVAYDSAERIDKLLFEQAETEVIVDEN